MVYSFMHFDCSSEHDNAISAGYIFWRQLKKMRWSNQSKFRLTNIKLLFWHMLAPTATYMFVKQNVAWFGQRIFLTRYTSDFRYWRRIYLLCHTFLFMYFSYFQGPQEWNQRKIRVEKRWFWEQKDNLNLLFYMSAKCAQSLRPQHIQRKNIWNAQSDATDKAKRRGDKLRQGKCKKQTTSATAGQGTTQEHTYIQRAVIPVSAATVLPAHGRVQQISGLG